MLAMESPVSAITELALAVSHEAPGRPDFPDAWRSFGDPVVNQLSDISYFGIEQHPAFVKALEELSRDPELASLLPRDNQPDPFIMSPVSGGSRVGFAGILTALLTNAAKQLFIQGIELTDSAFVRSVLENYEELKRAVRGEKIRSYAVRGLAGLSLDNDLQLTTPWGTIRPIDVEPSTQAFMAQPRPTTSALLVTPQLERLFISRENEPQFPGLDQSATESMQRTQTLTPLLFALSSLDSEAVTAPVITFQTTILPISMGMGYSSPLHSNPFVPNCVVGRDQVKAIEDLAAILAENYNESMQLASIRTVQAISQRTDRSDALIDAVMAWENLVGTRSETVYRVTAALARLLETEDDKRRSFRKELQDIYNIRSRVVHGDVVEPQAIQSASDGAVRIALRAMLEIYRRGGAWLAMSSNERSEMLILGEN
jgi:hypothetical protein